MILIGIDPGTSGGIAWYFEGDLPLALPMPSTEPEVTTLLRNLKNSTIGPAYALIEVVGAVNKGARKEGVKSMFTFGRNYGYLRGACSGLGISVDDVRPQDWRVELGCSTKPPASCDTESKQRTFRKNLTKQKAQALFPHLEITHATADALLILEYHRRVHAERA